MTENFALRAYRDSDLKTLTAMNAASTPGVSEETEHSLSEIFSVSRNVIVAANLDDRPVAFISLVEPGTPAYQSPNLRWFEAWQGRDDRPLIYVDRIAVAADMRGQRLGERLYREAFASAAGTFSVIGCEVNTDPDNPGSRRFHQRMGFEQVGTQRFSSNKAVAYYIRAI